MQCIFSRKKYALYNETTCIQPLLVKICVKDFRVSAYEIYVNRF